MRKTVWAISCILLLAACRHEPKSPFQKKVADYAVVEIAAPDLSGISDNGKEVLNLYRFAADEADRIYWKQYFGDKSEMEALPDEYQRTFAMINYGPWDRIDGAPFVDGYGARPSGANFYPADMTREEFDALADPAKTSPYTLLRRDGDGRLKAVWYHEEYKEHIDKIASYLTAAADITVKPSVKRYLLSKAEALRTDRYYDSDIAWIEMDDSKMDLVIGPNETNDDQLYGLKTSYEAFVLLKDVKKTEELRKFIAMLPELQKDLPSPEEYKAFEPGLASNIFACDALYYAGNANAGIKVIAINLPYDPAVQQEKGTRTLLLRNVMDAKFNRIVRPAGLVLVEPEQQRHLDAEAFFWNIAFREIAHGLGVKETVTGKGTVTEALGNTALTWEEAKANVVGMYLVCELIDRHELSGLVTKEDALTTFFTSLVRSERFGEGAALGRANIMIYNYLKEKGSFTRDGQGRYHIDYAAAERGIAEFAALILKTQATGDYAFARQFEADYSKVPDTYSADQTSLRLENIPVDIRFSYKK